MDSELSWWPIGRLDLNLQSAPINMIWRMILFEVLLFSEFRCSHANMAAKCRCILLQKGFELSMTDGLGDHFHFLGCFTLVHNFKLFPNVIREILLFYIVNNWRDFLIITACNKCFRVCWNAGVFSKQFQLQSVILMLRAETGSSICKICKYKVFQSHLSKRCEWTRHVIMLRFELLMKITPIIVQYSFLNTRFSLFDIFGVAFSGECARNVVAIIEINHGFVRIWLESSLWFVGVYHLA